ncbi:DUF3619 family protein [Paracidovorax sp. MALMAid1276]|uniref:DUF3619 family protein n=1 Tax=Paracidovorax sp. MALMAid1276 TaxID=3411631 RepID=UPI003B9BFC48
MNTVRATNAPTEAAAERYALRVAARLSRGTEDLPYDISERLRASRMQALARRKRAAAPARVAAPVVVSVGHTAALGRGGDQGSGWSNALVSAVPLMALVVGLVVINSAQDENSANDLAEVDAALLTDDLPPAAYADPGFVQFLKTSARAN